MVVIINKAYMNKTFIIFALCTICMNAYAQQTRNAIFTLTDSQKETIIREYGSDAFQAAKAKNITILMLDLHTTIKMGVLSEKYFKTVRELKLSDKSYSEKMREKKRLENSFYNNVQALIGDEKYAQWRHYIETKAERKYMDAHGFTPEQIAAYSHEAFKATETEEIKRLHLSPEIAITMGELVAEYNSEKRILDDMDLYSDERQGAKKQLKGEHRNKIRALIGEEKFKIWEKYDNERAKRSYMEQFNLTESQVSPYCNDAFNYVSYNEIKLLNLPPLKALQMGELKAEYESSLRELPQDLPEKSKRKKELKSHFHQSIKELIGTDKFLEWIAYLDKRLERKFINEYGFTPEQFQIYQDLENWQAVSIMRIKSSAIPKEEKLRRIQQIQNTKIDNLKKTLPSEQFEKWHKVYMGE